MNPTEEIIRSRQNRTVVETAKLTDRKARDAGGCFRFDGIKLFEEAIKKGVEIKTVLLRESSRQRIQDEMKTRCGEDVFSRFSRVLVLSDEVFDKISE